MTVEFCNEVIVTAVESDAKEAQNRNWLTRGMLSRWAPGTLLAPRPETGLYTTYPMTLKLWILAGGLLAFAAAGSAIRRSRARAKRFTYTDQLSSDWLSQTRAREEHPW